MYITALVLACIAGGFLGFLAYRITRNRGLSIIVPLAIVACAAIFFPSPSELAPEDIANLDPVQAGSPSGSGQPDRGLMNRGLNSLPEPGGQRQSIEESKKKFLSLASFEESRPVEIPENGYAGSDSCIECHKDNHSTWDNSYHSTMTQLATPDIVMGNLESVRLSFAGQDYEIQRQGDVFWADLPDDKFPDDRSKRKVVPIVMTTGSHHMQVYWWATGDLLRRIPVYRVAL